LQLFHGRTPKANREISAELMRRGDQLFIQPGNGPFHIEELKLKESDKFQELARRFFHPLSGAADFTVSFRWHPVFEEMPAAHQILANSWWSGTIPTDWVKPITEHVTEVWVPSQYVRHNFIAGGVDEGRVKVIPLGFDPAVFHHEAAPAGLKSRRKFKFLYVGETTYRKGFDILLNAYVKTFTAKDDVCLVVKDIDCEDYYRRLAGQDAIRQCQANPHCPEIEYLETMVGETELAGLYRACDCFVQPVRASSFGMAALEAMACGLPVLTTNHGGILEFCNDQTAILLPAREIRIRPKWVGRWKVNGDQVIAEVEFTALQARMEQAYRDPSAFAAVAQIGRQHVHATFTWTHTVDRIAARFDSLKNSGGRRKH
jgi:glycosyltransferase involved in cell wall biosynthesis